MLVLGDFTKVSNISKHQLLAVQHAQCGHLVSGLQLTNWNSTLEAIALIRY